MTGKYNGTSPRQNQMSRHSNRHQCNNKHEKEEQYVSENMTWDGSKLFEKQRNNQEHDADWHNQIHQRVVHNEEVQKIKNPNKNRYDGSKR